MSPEYTALIVAVVLPFLKFAPPARGTVSALAFAHAGSAAPAASTGGLATWIAVTTSAADAGNAKAALSNAAGSRNIDELVMTIASSVSGAVTSCYSAGKHPPVIAMDQ